jgi:hypothetical protein
LGLRLLLSKDAPLFLSAARKWRTAKLKIKTLGGTAKLLTFIHNTV